MSICVCTICGAQFARKRHTTGKYCGRRCAWLARGGTEFNARIARDSAPARGDAQRGRGEGKTYRKLNGRHEHRVIGEAIAGRKLRHNEHVHHKDGNIRNNAPENLEVLPAKMHMQKHGLAIPGMTLWWKPHEKRWPKGKSK